PLSDPPPLTVILAASSIQTENVGIGGGAPSVRALETATGLRRALFRRTRGDFVAEMWRRRGGLSP
ncbi:MAG: hypothetical protein ACK4OP_02480, partial [Gemmobacter sp.]